MKNIILLVFFVLIELIMFFYVFIYRGIDFIQRKTDGYDMEETGNLTLI